MNRYFASGVLVLGAALCASSSAHAAGFSLLEQTGSGIGDSYAGAAA
jgi:long-subunit fatty acid transport protein